MGGKVGDRQVRVGSRNYLESEGVVFPDSMVETLAAYDGEDRGLWHFYVAADGEALGRISCCDGVRGESERVIAGLHQRGLEVCLVTSNCAEVAQAIAAQVNIPAAAVHAETSPEAKVDLIHAFQAVGKTVVYLGEGLDDYAALCAADVAIGTNRSCHLIREMGGLAAACRRFDQPAAGDGFGRPGDRHHSPKHCPDCDPQCQHHAAGHSVCPRPAPSSDSQQQRQPAGGTERIPTFGNADPRSVWCAGMTVSRREFLGTASTTIAATVLTHGCTGRSLPPATGSTAPEVTTARLGFVPLLDAAPLIVAQEKGYFAKYGMPGVELVPEMAWETIQRNLTIEFRVRRFRWRTPAQPAALLHGHGQNDRFPAHADVRAGAA